MRTRVKKNLSVIMALLVAVSMMFAGNLASVFADINEDPVNVTVKNVEAGATVKAYKIVEKGANGNWKAVKDGSIANVSAPTADEIIALSQRNDLGTGTVLNRSGDVYQAKLGPGMYLVLVSKTNSEKVYNPMIVSVNYDYDAGKLKGGEVDANGKFGTVYAKSSKPTLKKEVVKENNPSVTNDGAVDHGDTLAVGDFAKFKITTTIPSYSKQYTNAKFEIKDTVSEGLDPAEDIVVKEGANTLTANTEYELEKNGRTFTIKFKKDYLLSGSAAKTITVTYKAKLNDKAKTGFDANTNEVGLKYSNSPSTEDDSKKDKTYHYTFDIDGNVGGTNKLQGKEIIKVGVDKITGDVIKKVLTKDLGSVNKRLAGAKFALYKAGPDGKPVGNAIKTATTDSDGLMKFTGLDAGKYVLKETEAPKGYVLNDKEIPVEITATLNADGTLKSYTVTIDGKATTTYTGTYQGGTVTTKVEDNSASGIFQNVKPGGLPSTGGIGTYIFMIVGGALVALAAALFVRNRRKQNA